MIDVADVRALVAEAREWAERSLPPSPWADNHIALRLADALEAAHAEPDNDEREALINALNREDHAPMEDHDPRDGSCRSCPWPIHMLGASRIADAVIAEGFRRRGTPATVEQVAAMLVEAADQPITPENVRRRNEYNMAEWIAARFIVLNRESNESQTGDDR